MNNEKPTMKSDMPILFCIAAYIATAIIQPPKAPHINCMSITVPYTV